MSDREVQLRLVRMLLARRSDSEGGGSGATFEGGTGGDKSQQQQKQQQDTQVREWMSMTIHPLPGPFFCRRGVELLDVLQRDVVDRRVLCSHPSAIIL